MGELFFAMFIISKGLRAITIIRKNHVSSSVLGGFRQELRNESGQQRGPAIREKIASTWLVDVELSRGFRKDGA